MYLILTKSVEQKQFLNRQDPLNLKVEPLCHWPELNDLSIVLYWCKYVLKDIRSYCPESEMDVYKFIQWVELLNQDPQDILNNPKLVGYQETDKTRIYYRLHWITEFEPAQKLIGDIDSA